MKRTNIFFVIIVTVILIFTNLFSDSLVSATVNKISEPSYYEEIKNLLNLDKYLNLLYY